MGDFIRGDKTTNSVPKNRGGPVCIGECDMGRTVDIPKMVFRADKPGRFVTTDGGPDSRLRQPTAAVSPSPRPSPAVTLDLLTGYRFAGEGARAAALLGLGFGLTDLEVCRHGLGTDD